MSIRTLIVDDEPLALRVLEKYVTGNPLLALEAGFTDPLQAFAYLQQHPVDLLFLDINMPELSGLALVRSLTRPPVVVFTTAYPEYAVEGFEVEAADYLVKPIAPERFLKAVEKAHRLLRPAVKEEAPQNLIVRADRKIYRLPIADVLYLQAYGDYVKVVCRNKVITPKEKLRTLGEMLPADQFLRIHRSFIVALNKIEYMEGNLVFIAGQSIPVAQAQRDTLLDFLQ